MKLITGLGNPGKKYEGTRHNIGFMAVDELKKEKLDKVIFLKPETFMNSSGKAVKEKAKYQKFEADDIWVIHDDIDLPIGEYKISKGQGSAGHKGVQSIIDELKTKDFNRVRIGICPKSGKLKAEKIVLLKFSKEEKEVIKETIKSVVKDLIKLLK